MGIEYRIDEARGATFAVWDGPVTGADWLAHLKRLRLNLDWPPTRRLHLSDMREVSPDAAVDEAAIERAVELLALEPDKIAGMKVAVVVRQGHGRAAFFQRLFSRLRGQVMICATLESACAWLELDPREVGPLLDQLRAQARLRSA